MPQRCENLPLLAGGEKKSERFGCIVRTLRCGRPRQARARVFPDVIGRPRQETPLRLLQRAAELLVPRCSSGAGEAEEFNGQKVGNVRGLEMREVIFREAFMLQCREQPSVLRRQRLVMARHAGGFKKWMVTRKRCQGFDVGRSGRSQGAPDQRGGKPDAPEARIHDHARDRRDPPIKQPGGMPAILLRELPGQRQTAQAAIEHGPCLHKHSDDGIINRAIRLAVSRDQHPCHRHRACRAVVEVLQARIIPLGPFADCDLTPQ